MPYLRSAGLGALVRYAVGLAAAQAIGNGFPWGTLIVNVAGCFVLEIMADLEGHSMRGLLERSRQRGHVAGRGLVGIRCCGFASLTRRLETTNTLVYHAHVAAIHYELPATSGLASIEEDDRTSAIEERRASPFDIHGAVAQNAAHQQLYPRKRFSVFRGPRLGSCRSSARWLYGLRKGWICVASP